MNAVCGVVEVSFVLRCSTGCGVTECDLETLTLDSSRTTIKYIIYIYIYNTVIPRLTSDPANEFFG